MFKRKSPIFYYDLFLPVVFFPGGRVACSRSGDREDANQRQLRLPRVSHRRRQQIVTRNSKLSHTRSGLCGKLRRKILFWQNGGVVADSYMKFEKKKIQNNFGVFRKFFGFKFIVASQRRERYWFCYCTQWINLSQYRYYPQLAENEWP